MLERRVACRASCSRVHETLDIALLDEHALGNQRAQRLHGGLALVRIHKRQCLDPPAGTGQLDGARRFVELGTYQAAQRLQFFQRTVARLHALLERMQPAFDLTQGFVVGKEIDLSSCQEVAALAGFGVAHAGQEPLETQLEFLGSQDFVAGIREQLHRAMRDNTRNDEHDARYTEGNADDGL